MTERPLRPFCNRKKIGESYCGVGVAHYVQFWNPGPLFVPLDSLKSDVMHSVRGLGSSQKYFTHLNRLIITLHLSFFHNGLSDLPTITIFDSRNNLVMTV